MQNRKGGERHVIVSREGKPAQTRVQLSRKHGKYSLLQCSPVTGRTHQIRVHLEHYDHPLLGDERYGEGEENRAAKKLGLKRLFLHAQSIAFPDDSGNERILRRRLLRTWNNSWQRPNRTRDRASRPT